MKNLLLLVSVLTASISYGQSERSANKLVTENFIKHYNADDFKAIFSMFSGEMAKALPIDKTTGFLVGLKSQAGNITDRKFVKYEDGTYASYKATFEKAIFTLNISIDAASKINGLLVKPFVEETSSENMINALANIDHTITKEQTDLIFEKVKGYPNQTQLAFAIIKNGNVSHYGVKRNDETISTIDNHTSIFEIGSISKVFTSTLLASLVLDDKIKLNDDIGKYLDVALNNNTEISFEELSNHTSGLPRLPSNLDLTKVDIANPYKDYGESNLEEYLTNSLDLPGNIKKHYEYSNLGAGLLGFTLSEIEGVSFDQLLQNRIFSKYKMSNSTSESNNVNGDIINGLDAEGNVASNWEFSVLAGAGGIFSNVDDLSRFALAQFDESNKELGLTRQKTFVISDNMDIGLSWHILKKKDNKQWIWHNGGTGGYSSSMVIDAKNRNGIILLSNVSAFNAQSGLIDDLCFELMETLDER